VPSHIDLTANLSEIEQNNYVVLSARLLDQYGNPVPNEEVSLHQEHPNFVGEVVLDNRVTDVRGMALFEITLRAIGTSRLSAYGANHLASAAVEVNVLPSSISIDGPRSWQGVARSLSRLQFNLSTVMGRMIAQGADPTKEEICAELGLDYQRANDRNQVSKAIYELKIWFDYLWRVLYQRSPSYGKDYSVLRQDLDSYSKWKNDSNSPHPYLRTYYHLLEEEVRELWILSRMWDIFVETANQYNLHLFVGYKAPDGWHYKQPNFWEYVDKQIRSASRMGKGIRTILTRHRDLGMILTSGQSIHKALEGAEDVRKMITDRVVSKFRCPMCSEKGTLTEFPNREEWIRHVKACH